MAVGTGDDLRPDRFRSCDAAALAAFARAQEAARRRADRTADHGGEGARAGVAELGGDARHRQLARRQRHGASEQHLLAPLHERRAELAAEEARQGARARAGVGGPGGERGVARRAPRSPLRRGGAGAFPAAGRRPGGTGAARRSSSRSSAARRRSRASVSRDRRRATRVGRRIELQRQGEQQARDLEDAALAPARRFGRRARRPAARARLMQVEREQLGVLDHRHRVLDAGRDPDRARRRHDVAAVRRGDADHAGRRHATCPQGCACGTTRVSARRRSSLARSGRAVVGM